MKVSLSSVLGFLSGVVIFIIAKEFFIKDDPVMLILFLTCTVLLFLIVNNLIDYLDDEPKRQLTRINKRFQKYIDNGVIERITVTSFEDDKLYARAFLNKGMDTVDNTSEIYSLTTTIEVEEDIFFHLDIFAYREW